MKTMAGRLDLNTEVQYVPGVGPRQGALLNKFGILTARDLVHHLPRRYEDRRNFPPMRQLKPGQFATVRGKVKFVDAGHGRRGKAPLKVLISDGSGAIQLLWFNQPWLAKKFGEATGDVIAYGMVRLGNNGVEMTGPEFEIVDEEDEIDEFLQITPIYPLTEGLSQKPLRKAIRNAIQELAPDIIDPLPAAFRATYRLAPLGKSLLQLHRPSSEEAVGIARRRLVFEEFLRMQIQLQYQKSLLGQEPGIAFSLKEIGLTESKSGLFGPASGKGIWEEIREILPFELTPAQQRVIGEIFHDMEKPTPMNRLVQGDVGSGKTAVAACAMLAAARCGYQTALMAPTEILAEQHALNLSRLFEPVGLRVQLLTGKMGARDAKKARERIATREVQLVIGTHALIQEGVEFHNLGLAIIDEQHRFGVLQRAALRRKAKVHPDVLVMTATPIPRTLTMAIYGDLDVSIVDSLPPGRKPIKTHWRATRDRDMVYDSVRKIIEEGRQAYFVCPNIEGSEKLQTQAATDLHYRLSTEIYPDFRLGLLHGQLKSAEKEAVMDAFRRHELDVLVATVVIEVGVDVPNASVMVVEDANRFGLSQLHQIRGRVGRGGHQSFCILIADAKSDESRERMQAMVDSQDGFKIAEIDLKLRGPGDVLGTKQSGSLDLKIADLIRDFKLLEEAKQAAEDLLKSDPNLSHPDHRVFKDWALSMNEQEIAVPIS